MSITTILTTPEHGTITHTGTSGFTVTAQREGEHVETLIEYSKAPAEEMREMVCVLLCMLEDVRDERFVASCFARYAEETGKKFMEAGDGHKLVIIRGAKRP